MAVARGKRKTSPSKSESLFGNLKSFRPLTDNQGLFLEFFEDGKNVLAVGSAGTGKTFAALNLALEQVKSGDARQIIIVRSAVPARDQGFLPGTIQEKMAVYETPYTHNVNKIMGRGDGYEILKNQGIIKFESTSFLRGDTFEDCIVIADEIQNYDFGEVNTLMTRLGKNSRIILCGDVVQADEDPKKSGFHLLNAVIPSMRQFGVVRFGHEDIVRSELVKSWIIAVERYSSFYENKSRSK